MHHTENAEQLSFMEANSQSKESIIWQACSQNQKEGNSEDRHVDHSSVEENNGSATQAKIQCQRCIQQAAKYQCPICKHVLCQECDSLIHRSAKLANHSRRQLRAEDKLEDCESQNYIKIKISSVKQVNQSDELLSTAKALVVNQKWDKIIHDIKIKFQEIINIVQDKMEQIISKMDKKRHDEIRECANYLKELKGIRKLSVSDQSCKRSNISQKVQTLHPRLKPNECDSLQDINKVLGQIDINNNYFQEVKSSVQKIQIKNIISKTMSPLESEHKKKMRKSMQLNLNTTMSQAAYSSGIRSPKHAKISFSTLIQQRTMQSSSNNNNVTNQQEMDMVRLKNNEGKMLQKVKSEKIILKSGNSKTDVSMARRETAKLKKMEIMI